MEISHPNYSCAHHLCRNHLFLCAYNKASKNSVLSLQVFRTSEKMSKDAVCPQPTCWHIYHLHPYGEQIVPSYRRIPGSGEAGVVLHRTYRMKKLCVKTHGEPNQRNPMAWKGLKLKTNHWNLGEAFEDFHPEVCMCFYCRGKKRTHTHTHPAAGCRFLLAGSYYDCTIIHRSYK